MKNIKMIDQINDELKKLEEERGIKILLAVESGSRAWGIPSPDSDYDVRMIYVHKKDWYLSIEERKETIDYFEGELLDISGWDIRKTFKLVRKSNASPMEWCRSSIVYKEDEIFRKELLDLTSHYFVPRHTVNHYWGIAKNSFHSNYKAGQIRLKKLFYVLRPLLAAKWIIEKGEIPPITLDALMVLIRDKNIFNRITELIAKKDKSQERLMYTLDADVKLFIDSLFDEVNSANIIDDEKPKNTDLLNEKFREIINRYSR